MGRIRDVRMYRTGYFACCCVILEEMKIILSDDYTSSGRSTTVISLPWKAQAELSVSEVSGLTLIIPGTRSGRAAHENRLATRGAAFILHQKAMQDIIRLV